MPAVRPLLSDYPVSPWLDVGVGDTRIPTGQARWDQSSWDRDPARWAGTEPTWLDASCHVSGASCDRGRERVIDRFGPATSDVVLRNDDGWADLAPPPAPPAALTLRPGRQIRWGVETPLGRQPLFRGYIDEAVPIYQPFGSDVVSINAFCALTEAGRPTLEAHPGDVGVGDTGDVRIARLLDTIGWPNVYRDLAPTSYTLIGSPLGGAVVDLVGVAAESTGGSVFGDLNGRVVFRARDWQTFLPNTPPAATIGNVDPSDVCPSTWELAWRRRDVAAYVRMGRPDGVFVSTVDHAAAVTVGLEPFVRDDLEAADVATLTALADRAIATRGLATMPRIEAVTLDAAHDPGDGSVVELMATASPEAATRVRCRLRPRDNRVAFDVDMFVTGVAHAIDDRGRWTARFALDVSAPYAATGARWDRGRWDRSTWSS